MAPGDPRIAEHAALSEATANADPIEQFRGWYEEARAAGEVLPEAMMVATASADGVPSARMVLLRGFDDRGFGFFTNYDSQKGRELRENPRAALVIYWPKLGRQVRVGGEVVRQTVEESQAYFSSRPKASQVSAWASNQSEVIRDREVLEAAARELAARYEGTAVPLPPNWGGYRVVPHTIEFWIHRDNRLHDRLRYTRRPGGWRIERLAP